MPTLFKAQWVTRRSEQFFWHHMIFAKIRLEKILPNVLSSLATMSWKHIHVCNLIVTIYSLLCPPFPHKYGIFANLNTSVKYTDELLQGTPKRKSNNADLPYSSWRQSFYRKKSVPFPLTSYSWNAAKKQATKKTYPSSNTGWRNPFPRSNKYQMAKHLFLVYEIVF